MAQFAKLSAWILAIGLIAGGAWCNWSETITDYSGQAWEWSQPAVTSLPEVVVIEETGNRTVPTADVYNSKDVRLEASKCKLFRWTDKDAKGPDIGDIQWALTAAKPVATEKMPVVCVRRSGKVTVNPLPKTPAAMIVFLQKNGA